MELQRTIEAAFSSRDALSEEAKAAVHETIARLDRGELRVAEKKGDTWQTHTWIKQAILLYFDIAEMQVSQAGPFEYFDKIPLKKGLDKQGVRVVPPGTIRYGAFVERGVVLMPGYINIGAWVGSGTMVDTWATVGSCAQIGRNVHLSGGAGIGGVLEPLQAAPVIIEDGAFVGSRSIVVEGVHVGEQAVLGAGVVLTASTPIIDVTGSKETVTKGEVAPRSVIVPGTRAKDFPAGTYNLSCALMVGQRQKSTDLKTSLTDVLRRFALQV